MGNCSPRPTTQTQTTPTNNNNTTIRVLTDSGAVLYLPSPKPALEDSIRTRTILPHGPTSRPFGRIGNLYGNGPKKRGDGVWKVKLVMGSKQLEEIMSEEVNVEALIQRMREAAAVSPSSRSTLTAGKARAGMIGSNFSSILRPSSC